MENIAAERRIVVLDILAPHSSVVYCYHGLTVGGGTGVSGSLLPELATTTAVVIPAAAAPATTNTVFWVLKNPKLV
jgi:hypothetical protein